MIQIEKFMIGDWVIFTDPEDGVREYHQIEAADYGQDERYYRCLEPTPISIPFLVNNGFKPQNVFNSVWRRDLEKENYRIVIDFLSGNRIKIHVGENSTNYNYIVIKANFIHFLQQALRLASLYSVADSFKVDKGGEK